MTLEKKLQELPTSPGVYQYFDKDGRLLYIGKAKVLKNRIKSYFKFTPALTPADKLSPRIYKMISEVASLEWIVVPSEHDALILENSLIKQLKPKYNILLRDDKTYPYIYIDYSQDFPRLEITRKILKGSRIKYFGPYSSGARDMLESIYEIIPLVQKKSCIKGNQACLFYQIGKCLAPCEGKISKDEYKKLIDEALELIQNKNRLISRLTDKMETLSTEFRFEEAMALRERIKNIGRSEIKTSLDFANRQDIDMFAIKADASNTRAVIVKMFIRGGKLVSSLHSFIRLGEFGFDMQEAYTTALVNYYNDNLPLSPKEVITAHEIKDKESLEELLKNRFGKNIPLSYPKIGKKKELVQIALNNCEELLKIDSQVNHISIYQELKSLFNLQSLPFRIETYDNSHMMGQASVGAMTVWDGKFIKEDYRHYNLESHDEYSQMKETLTKRVESFSKNPAPDLWVIDGGSALLKLAMDILESVGVNIDVIAIAKEKVDAKAHRAKGKAKDIIYTNDEVYKLHTSDKRLQFIQRLRDEAHRFAIAFHKKQKRKEDKQVSLLQIRGIGEAKVKKLLDYFGTFENIKNATMTDLEEILNKKDSLLLLEYFDKKAL